MNMSYSVNIDEFLNITSEMSPTPPSRMDPRMVTAVMVVLRVLAVLPIIGVFTNAGVFAVLMRARRQHGSNVNTLIINQTVMDLSACFLLLVNIFMGIANANYVETSTRLTSEVMCVLFQGGALLATCLNAGKIGLVVITLERYFKIVHPIAHRKLYCDWMTAVGAALPWMSGSCVILFPAIATSRIVNGTCRRESVWPSKATATVGKLLRSCIVVSILIGTGVQRPKSQVEQ